MYSMFSFGFIIVILFIIVSRIISEKGLKRLDAEQKSRLLDAFSFHRIFYLVPLLALLVLYTVLIRALNDAIPLLFVLFLMFMVLYIIGYNLLSYRKLKKIEMPKDYIFHFILARTISFFGILIFFSFLIIGMY